MIRFIRELKFAPAILVVACGIVFSWASLRACAAWHFVAPESVSAPLFGAGAFRQVDFDSADRHLRNAMERVPNNPDCLGLSGRLKELQASQPGIVDSGRLDMLQAAAQDYRRALAVRPLWPYGWANLLGVKSRMGEIDGEFRLALAQCVETGPWEPRVQMQVLESGLEHWDHLGREEKERVRQQLSAAVSVQPRLVFERIRAFGRADLLCPLSAPQPQIENYCKSAGTR